MVRSALQLAAPSAATGGAELCRKGIIPKLNALVASLLVGVSLVAVKAGCVAALSVEVEGLLGRERRRHAEP